MTTTFNYKAKPILSSANEYLLSKAEDLIDKQNDNGDHGVEGELNYERWAMCFDCKQYGEGLHEIKHETACIPGQLFALITELRYG